MLIGNKVFPYPLLRDKDSNTDYKTTQFCFDFEMDNGIPMIVNGNLILKNISFYLDNPELKELYADGFVKAICEVECSNTVYREFFEITESPQTKKIPITNFANIVTISAYLVATKEICAFISTDFVDDYEGYSFHINPSNVLAADDGIKFRVDIDESNDNKMSSIFTIVGDERFWMWLILEKCYAATIQAMPMESGKKIIADHWLFGQGRRRGLMFGALSRAYYRVQLTKDDTLEDAYELTKFATQNYMRYREFTWRGYSNNKTIVTGALKGEKKAIAKYGDTIETIKDYYPSIAKHISQLGSVMLLDFMREDYILDSVLAFCDSLAEANNIMPIK